MTVQYGSLKLIEIRKYKVKIEKESNIEIIPIQMSNITFSPEYLDSIQFEESLFLSNLMPVIDDEGNISTSILIL